MIKRQLTFFDRVGDTDFYMEKAPILLRYFTTIELTLAKQLLFICGYALHRKNADILLAFPQEQENHIYNEDDAYSLYVDEGFWSDTLAYDCAPPGVKTVKRINFIWEEVVSSSNVLGLMCKKLVPDFKPEWPDCIGHNRRERELFAQYYEALRGHYPLETKKNA